MRDSDFAGFVVIACIAIAVTLASACLGHEHGRKDAIKEFQQQAIERGVAEYNAMTGEWQWKESKQ